MPDEQGTLSGALLGDYQVGTLLGVHGPLAMYRTVDPTSKSDLAIGVIAGPAAAHRDLLDVIRRVVALKHTHIIPVFDVGADGETRFLVVPTLRDALRERLARDGALSPIHAGQLVAQVAWAVVAMREAGLPEPPISTSNILLDDEGLAILADTSLARGGTSAIRAFHLGGAAGWPIHIAPYLGGARVARATQSELVYALGTVLYELLTATEKPENPAPEQTETLMVTAPLELPSNRAPQLWLELEGVMLKALADERERFKDIREFAIEIRRVVSQLDDGQPSGKMLAVLQRGRKTSPPAFRLDEWAFVRAPSLPMDTAVAGAGSSQGYPVEDGEADWEEVVTGEEVSEQENAAPAPTPTDRAADAGRASPTAGNPSADNESPARPSTLAPARGRVPTVPLKPNKPISAAELRARLGGGPGPVPGKRLTGGAAPGTLASRATPTQPVIEPPQARPPTDPAEPRPIRQPPTGARAATPLFPPTPAVRGATGMGRELDATTRLPERRAPTSELLAEVAARTPPKPPDVRVRSTEPPAVSPIAVRPALEPETPPMYLGGGQVRLPRRRGERRQFPVLAIVALAVAVALIGAVIIALGAVGPASSNSNDNNIVVSATQTAQARNAQQPTGVSTVGPTRPARPGATPTATAPHVGAVIVLSPTPVPPAPTATPAGPAFTISPSMETATANGGSCSASYTITPARSGLSWRWLNDSTSPATLPPSAQYTINGAPWSGLPSDSNTALSGDVVTVTLPCNSPSVTYVLDLASGTGATTYLTFTLTA